MRRRRTFILSTATLSTIFAILLIVFFDVHFIDIFNFFKLIIGRFFVLYAIVVAIFIFLDNDDPYRTVSWILVLLLLPYIGIVLYILLGKNLRPKRIAIMKRESDMTLEERAAESQINLVDYFAMSLEDDRPARYAKLVKLLLKNSQSLISMHNDVEVLSNGVQTFSRIMKSLNNAEETINFEYFIIKDDGLGNKIKDILIRKAHEGVKVRIIYDAVGSWRLGKTFKEELRVAGIELYPFFPVAFPLITRRLNHRNHRKIIVVDGKIGYVGGLNIGDEYLGKDESMGYWRDTHLRIEGESVYSLLRIFINDWKFVSGEILDIDNIIRRSDQTEECLMQIAASGPDSDWKNIHQGYFTLVTTARDKIWIETPYLVPDESLRMALKTAALSGVDVRIIIPNKPDHFFVYWASRDNIEGLLEAGVKIYTYEKGFIHAKILIVDGLAASAGTANLDNRSFGTNYEVNAFIYGEKVIKRLEEDFVMDLGDSKEVSYEEHLKRGVMDKTKEALGRLVSPIQ
jgi:cardiolipin synthase